MSIPLNQPVELALDALQTYFERVMPEIEQIIQDFPNPNDQLKYPTLTITHQAEDGAFTALQPYEDSVSAPDAQKKVGIVWVCGHWDYKVQLDFWCRSEPERNRIMAKAKDVLNPNINPMGLRLQLPNYHGAWASFDLSGMRHEDNEQASQRGEWRVILTLLAHAPELREERTFAITEPVAIQPVLVNNDQVPL